MSIEEIKEVLSICVKEIVLPISQYNKIIEAFETLQKEVEELKESNKSRPLTLLETQTLYNSQNKTLKENTQLKERVKELEKKSQYWCDRYHETTRF